MPYFMTAIILYIKFIKPVLDKRCQFLRSMAPLTEALLISANSICFLLLLLWRNTKIYILCILMLFLSSDIVFSQYKDMRKNLVNKHSDKLMKKRIVRVLNK